MLNASSPPKKLPAVRETMPLFAMLFGNNTVCKLRKDSIPTGNCAVVATYRDSTGAIQRLLNCNLAFANSTGAALSAIPSASVKSATNSGRLADTVIAGL